MTQLSIKAYRSYQSWSDEVIHNILFFVGSGYFLWLSPVSKTWHKIYKLIDPQCVTSLKTCVDSLERLRECLDINVDSKKIKLLFTHATKFGRRNILEELESRGHVPSCYLPNEAYFYLALDSNDIPTIEFHHKRHHTTYFHIFEGIKSHWSVDVIKWLQDSGAHTTQKGLNMAAMRGNIPALELLLTPKYKLDSLLCAAASANSVPTIQYLLTRGGSIPYEITQNICYISALLHAAESGNEEALSCLIDRCQPFEWYGSDSNEWPYVLPCLQFSIRQGEGYSKVPATQIFANAAVGAGCSPDSMLRVCKMLYDIECPWDKQSCFVAASYGQLEVLQWLYQHGCPCHASGVFKAGRMYPEIVAWVEETFGPIEEYIDSDGNDDDWWDDELNDEWLYEEDIDRSDARAIAANGGSLEFVDSSNLYIGWADTNDLIGCSDLDVSAESDGEFSI